MLESDIWVADLVKALTALSPANDYSADAIAALLGVKGFLETDVALEKHGPLATDLDTRPDSQAEAPAVEQAAAAIREVQVDGSSESRNAAQDIGEVLRPFRTEAPLASANRWPKVTALERRDSGSSLPEPAHEPLFDPRWQREIAIAAAAQPLPLGGIDVRALVDRAARGLPVVRVPRKRRWSVNRGVQLLIDGGAGMEPFRKDQAIFANVVNAVVGAERVEILEFEDAPLRGVFDRTSGMRREYRPPAPGTPVVVLSDLGQGGPLEPGLRATGREWQQFADRVTRGSRIVSFIPFPPDLLPEPVRRAAGAVYWNRSTAHRQIREAFTHAADASSAAFPARQSAVVRRMAADRQRRASELAVLVSPAVFVGPDLLRAMRLALLPRSGPEVESAVWFAKPVRARNPSGIVFHTAAAARLRNTLRDSWQTDPDLRSRLTLARGVMDRVHARQSAALRLEERLAWCVVTGDIETAERELERALKAHADGGRPGIATWAGQAWKRLPAEARSTRSGWLFHQLARSGPNGRNLGTVEKPADLRPEDISAALSLVPDVKFGVRRHDDRLELGNFSGDGAVAIMVPDTQPRTVDVLIGEDQAGLPVTLRSHERATVDVGRSPVTLRTMRGHLYGLPAVRIPQAQAREQPTQATRQTQEARLSWGHTWPAWELHFDKDGKPLNGAMPDIGTHHGITDLFVFVHGWNADRPDARSLYARLLEEPSRSVPDGVFRRRRFGAVGVFWPSKLWDDSDEEAGSPIDGSDTAESQFTEMERNIDLEQRRRLAEASQRLAAQPDDLEAREQVEAVARELGNRSESVFEAGDRPPAGDSGLFKGFWSGVKNVGRMVSYWSMRTRARTVGRSGLGPALGRLADPFPTLRLHLLAHSVGARLAVYAIQEGVRQSSSSPVKSLVLLQPILARDAFSSSLPSNPRQAGALASVPGKVDGPIVVTYSTADRAAGVAYDSVTRVAGGDDDAAGERTMKAMGFEGAHGVSATSVRLGPVGTSYPFFAGRVVNVDASALITGHSDVTHPEIAWLMLGAADAATQNSGPPKA